MRLLPKTCFFTGHRVIGVEDRATIKKQLEQEIVKAIAGEVSVFIAGGAVGFDMIAAETVLRLKKEYPIQLSLYLPCKNHDILWNEGERLRLEYIKSMADEIYYVTHEEYKDGCMKKRNMAMVEASDMCIAYIKSNHSGTAQTLKMAEEKNLKIVKIANH